ncbi:MAG: hypothetical protein EXR62_00075 [Chloroflexi bacterium]|nr:hypothetical protein [Chloroflexota bacterium]
MTDVPSVGAYGRTPLPIRPSALYDISREGKPMKRAIIIGIALCLVCLLTSGGAAIAATPAAPAGAGCVPAGAYDQNCDVNRDGSIDVQDLQLVTSHWHQTGAYVSPIDGWSLSGNGATNPITNFLGTTDNLALELRVNGRRGLRLEPTNSTSAPNLIGGFSGNSVAANTIGASIGGGGQQGAINQVTADFATIGGGLLNVAGGSRATIGGGVGNSANGAQATVGGGSGNGAGNARATVGGGESNFAGGQDATISGGASNTASGTYTTVGGGQGNAASGESSTISGGLNNQASGTLSAIGGGIANVAHGEDAAIGGGISNSAAGVRATVPGGRENAATGDYSLAAGRQAKADHQGSFIWADSTNAEIHSGGSDQFIVRANGGLWLGAATGPGPFTPSIPANVLIATSSGAYLSRGGTWTNASDQALKANFAPVNGREILARLAAMPMSTWNYKSQSADIRHIGPVAQDFYAAFGVGEDNTHISTVDGDGVALAASQALYTLVQEKEQQISALQVQVSAQQEQIQALQKEHQSLEARLAALEKAVGTLSGQGKAP